MSDTTDLISRLRAVCETGCDPDLPFEAAATIEAQARENEALRADAERLCGELVALIPSEAA